MTAVCKVKRKGRPEVVTIFSKEKAINAKLWGKEGPWKTYPERMLQMRARGFALRDAFADRLKGIITAEEARDYPQPQRQPQKVIPISSQVQLVEPSQRIHMSEETQHRLVGLVDAVELSPERVQKIKEWAKVDYLEDMSEAQGLKVIHWLEKELSEMMKASVEEERHEN